jgi:hypothetical protein
MFLCIHVRVGDEWASIFCVYSNLASYSCQMEPAISILRLHLDVGTLLVIAFEVVLLFVSETETALHVFSSDEDDALQKLAPCPKCLSRHCSANALPEINQLARARRVISSYHLHITCSRSPRAATAMRGV